MNGGDHEAMTGLASIKTKTLQVPAFAGTAQSIPRTNEKGFLLEALFS
ncbi:hypothetical protein AFEL58S_01168 [Afipia felis]